MQESLVIDNA